MLHPQPPPAVGELVLRSGGEAQGAPLQPALDHQAAIEVQGEAWVQLCHAVLCARRLVAASASPQFPAPLHLHSVPAGTLYPQLPPVSAEKIAGLEQQKKQQDVQPQQPSVSAEMRELELWLRQQDAQPQHQQPGSDN